MVYLAIIALFFAIRKFVGTIKHFSPAKLVVLLAFTALLVYFYLTRPERMMGYADSQYNPLGMWLILLSLCWFQRFEGFMVGFVAYSLLSPAPFTLSSGDIAVMVACGAVAIAHCFICGMGGKIFWIWATLLSLFYSIGTFSLFGLFPEDPVNGAPIVWEPLLMTGVFLISFASFTLLRAQSQWWNKG